MPLLTLALDSQPRSYKTVNVFSGMCTAAKASLRNLKYTNKGNFLNILVLVSFFNNNYSTVLGIIVTGGGEDAVAVELLRADGSSICQLPSLPIPTWGHTQNGLTTCGGTRGERPTQPHL